METRRHKAIWLSDIHLGSRGCRADFLLDFLRHNDADRIYLLGDIVDGWRLRRQWYWPRLHNDVVQKVLRKARKGAEVVYVAGNHDEFLRDFLGLSFGGIRVEDEAVHTTADGRRVLMLHGDRYDGVVRYAKWLAVLGDWAYEFALFVNRHFNAVRRRLGYPYWSLSSYLKHRVKNAVNFISDFERLVAEEAARRDVDVVVCGHIHKAEMRYIDGTLYCNTGDWVESCTAMVEGADGRLRVLHWADGEVVLFDEALLPAPPAVSGHPDTSPAPALARESVAN